MQQRFKENHLSFDSGLISCNSYRQTEMFKHVKQFWVLYMDGAIQRRTKLIWLLSDLGPVDMWPRLRPLNSV